MSLAEVKGCFCPMLSDREEEVAADHREQNKEVVAIVMIGVEDRVSLIRQG